MKKMELLSPAGDMSSFYAAINNGADAIYLAGNMFGARAYAKNFTNEEIKEIIRISHLLNVKVYVTVNTLIKDSEFNECLNFVKFLYEADVDAVLVQDIGLLYTIHQAFPNLSLHASTQMNVHSVEDAKRIKELGCTRIVLARECDIDLIKKIKESVDIELEVFAHGALCMSYSGNCLMSSFIGKRSGNRGRCAGACRLKYKLIKNGEMVSDDAYFLSLKDLNTLDKIDKLKEIGVDSIKIEGRVKRSEYVGLVTKSYREAIDGTIDYKKREYELKEMFNRGFTVGHLFKEKNALQTNIVSPNHIGVNIGKVIKSLKHTANNQITGITYIKLSFENKNDTLKLSDSIRITQDNFEDGITLSRMNLCLMKDGNIKPIKNVDTAYDGDIICINTHFPTKEGMDVLKTSTNSLIKEFEAVSITKKVPIKGIIEAKCNSLTITLQINIDGKTIKVSDEIKENVVKANNPESYLRIKEQVSKINNTFFYFESLDYIGDNVFIQVKEINEFRRNLITKLEDEILKFRSKEHIISKFTRHNIEYSSNPSLIVKVRTKDQYEAARSLNIHTILTESQELKDEEGITYINPRMAYDKEGITDDLKYSSPYLNVMNAYSAYFMHLQGIQTVGLSLELSKTEIESLVYNYKLLFKNSPNLMMMVYGFPEVMIMKHCLINKFNNYDHKGCNECINNQYFLKDKLDYQFPLIKDEYCNLKVLNSMRINLIKYLKDIISIGVNSLLMDFTIETKEETLDYIQRFLQSMNSLPFDREIDLSTYGHFKESIE